MVIKGKYTVMSPSFSIRYTTTAKTRYKTEEKKKKKNARDDEEKRIELVRRNGKIVFILSICCRRRRRRRLALFCSIFGQRKSVYRKLFGYQIGTHGFRARRRMCNETENDSYGIFKREENSVRRILSFFFSRGAASLGSGKKKEN